MTLAVGLALVMVAFAWRRALQDPLSPAVTFAGTWGFCLSIEAFLPRLGYYGIGPLALLIYAVGVVSFSSAAGLLQMRFSPRSNQRCPRLLAPHLPTAAPVALGATAVNLVFALMFLNRVSPLGTDLASIAYQIRLRSVGGQDVFGPLLGNYIQAGTFMIPLISLPVLTRRWPLWLLGLAGLPWAAIMLVGAGRSALVQMILALMFLSFLFEGRVANRLTLPLIPFMVAVIVIGASLVGKIAPVYQGNGVQKAVPFAESALDYAAQGPILFSRYLSGEAGVTPNWSPTRGLCALFGSIGLCRAPNHNLEFNDFAPSKDGNVYSLFFSIFPHYGYLGVFVFLALYGGLCYGAYRGARRGSSVALVIYGLLFGAIVLSPFTDSIGAGAYLYMKATIGILILSALLWTAGQSRFRRRVVNRPGVMSGSELIRHEDVHR